MPKPPPTSPTVTRTCSRGRPSASQTESRTPEGIWVLMRRVSRPSSATQASTVRGSSASAATRWLASSSATTWAAAANAASVAATSP